MLKALWSRAYDDQALQVVLDAFWTRHQLEQHEVDLDPVRRALRRGGRGRLSAAAGIAPDPAGLRDGYDAAVERVLTEATLTRPDSAFAHSGGKTGARHSEHLGYLLAQLADLVGECLGNQLGILEALFADI